METHLFLIGDAGAPAAAGEPVLKALGEDLSVDPSRSLVVFLGDNAYPTGIPDSTDSGYAEALRRLDAQIDVVVQHKVRGYFLPGNHDWDRSGANGYARILRQGERVSRRGAGLVRMRPLPGCPGPVVADEGEWLRLVMLDTQWWLQSQAREASVKAGCVTSTEQGTIDSLRSAITGAGLRRVVVLGHHPLRSGGEHGGFFDWKDHLFPLRNVASWLWLPLPVIGSAYPLSRNLGISSQDMSGKAYKRMKQSFAEAFDVAPPLVYAAGHDHGLQVIEGGPAGFQLVSGAGIYSHEGPLTGIQGTELALQAAGYMRVDVLRDGRVRLGVITVDQDGTHREIQSRWLTTSASEP
ncbi:MAG TPA: metallophosphoesterase [Gemmatimonadales bacterium]|nr:metallophosphoesterase [Gemmatimonadales bacterium]